MEKKKEEITCQPLKKFLPWVDKVHISAYDNKKYIPSGR
jgi:hypothetical protein